METKICTYTEDKIKLNLVRVSEGDVFIYELRCNRKIIGRFPPEFGMLARYKFTHIVHDILVLRDSSILSKLTC